MRTLAGIAVILAALAGTLGLSISSSLRDQERLMDEFTDTTRQQVHASVEALSARLDALDEDTRMLADLLERSRGTPRVANRLLRRVRDFAEVRGDGSINGTTAAEGLDLFGVDELGLDKVDRAILETLCGRFGGQPIGLTTLAQCVGEEPDTIEDAYEPFLVQSGLIQRTARGRVATKSAWAHLGHAGPPTAPDAMNTPPLF